MHDSRELFQADCFYEPDTKWVTLGRAPDGDYVITICRSRTFTPSEMASVRHALLDSPSPGVSKTLDAQPTAVLSIGRGTDAVKVLLPPESVDTLLGVLAVEEAS